MCWPEEQVLIRSADGAASVRLAAHQAYEGLVRSNSNTTSSMEVWGLIAAEEQELAKNLCTREWSTFLDHVLPVECEGARKACHTAQIELDTFMRMVHDHVPVPTPVAAYKPLPAKAMLSSGSRALIDIFEQVFNQCEVSSDFDCFLDSKISEATQDTLVEGKVQISWKNGHFLRFLYQFPGWTELYRNNLVNYGVSFFDCTFGELLMLYMIAGPQEFEKGPEAIARCMQTCGTRGQWRFDPTGPQMTLFISYARQRLLTFLMGNHAEKSAVTTRRDWVFKALAKIRRTLDRPLLLADLPRYLGVPMSRVSCLLGDQRRQALFGTISQEPQSLPNKMILAMKQVADPARYVKGLSLTPTPVMRDPVTMFARTPSLSLEGVEDEAKGYAMSPRKAMRRHFMHQGEGDQQGNQTEKKDDSRGREREKKEEGERGTFKRLRRLRFITSTWG